MTRRAPRWRRVGLRIFGGIDEAACGFAILANPLSRGYGASGGRQRRRSYIMARWKPIVTAVISDPF
jgi:hypothetical protein